MSLFNVDRREIPQNYPIIALVVRLVPSIVFGHASVT